MQQDPPRSNPARPEEPMFGERRNGADDMRPYRATIDDVRLDDLVRIRGWCGATLCCRSLRACPLNATALREPGRSLAGSAVVQMPTGIVSPDMLVQGECGDCHGLSLCNIRLGDLRARGRPANGRDPQPGLHPPFSGPAALTVQHRSFVRKTPSPLAKRPSTRRSAIGSCTTSRMKRASGRAPYSGS